MLAANSGNPPFAGCLTLTGLWSSFRNELWAELPTANMFFGLTIDIIASSAGKNWWSSKSVGVRTERRSFVRWGWSGTASHTRNRGWYCLITFQNIVDDADTKGAFRILLSLGSAQLERWPVNGREACTSWRSPTNAIPENRHPQGPAASPTTRTSADLMTLRTYEIRLFCRIIGAFWESTSCHVSRYWLNNTSVDGILNINSLMAASAECVRVPVN